MAGVIAGGAVRLAIVPPAASSFVWIITTLTASAFFFKSVPAAELAAVGLVSLALFLTRHIRSYRQAQLDTFNAKTELAAQNETIGLLLNDYRDQSSDWLWETDDEGVIVKPSERFCESARIGRSRLEGIPLASLFTPEPIGLLERMEQRDMFRDIEVRLISDGMVLGWAMSGRPIYDAEHKFVGYRGVATDITDRIAATERLAYLAHHDSLTGLYNRDWLRSAAERALGELKNGGAVGLFLLDLDQFKSVNDSMGHPLGDELLAAVAARIQDVLGSQDLVARLGGDEFAVLHTDESDSWLPQEMSSTLLGAFRAPFRVADVELGIRTSIGVAHVNAHNAMGPDELIRSADLALYRAKAEGGGAMTFEPAMNARAQRRHELNQALRQAIERDQLSLCFQPIVDIETGRPVCFEALLRWSTPEFGAVSPTEFIAIAEETGQITTIGRWVLERAIGYAATWPDGTGVAVNLSAIQFRDQALPDLIRDVVRRHAFDLSRLELEITESTYLDAGDARQGALQALRNAGATISLDDFGTGYSSLSYLHNLPFNKLKIDKAFVRSSLVGADSHALLRSIIDIGHNFGMTVVAEGVEEPAQLEILRDHRCDQIQGYLISRPIPAEAVLAFLSGGSYGTDSEQVRDASAA